MVQNGGGGGRADELHILELWIVKVANLSKYHCFNLEAPNLPSKVAFVFSASNIILW